VGAEQNDMSRIQKGEMIKWMNNNPEKKMEAAMDFDRELIKDKKVRLSTTQALMSPRIYDAIIGNYAAHRRSWHPLERQGNQALGWYP
jgi:hypothetical protein